jgi:DNA repair protein RadC
MLRLARALGRYFRTGPGPSRTAETKGAVGNPTLSHGVPYSRFSLALVRQEPELPYPSEKVVNSTPSAVPFLHRLLEREPYECFGALLLDCRNRPIGHTIPFRGALDRCGVEPRPLLVTALMANAAALLAFHQHPSGDPTPSPQDRGFARRLAEAGHVVGVQLRDFVVLGEPPTFCSLQDGAPSPAAEGALPGQRRRTRKPKYRHPDDLASTWAGTGFMPVWLRQEIEEGASLADFLVEGARVTEAAARQEHEIRERIARAEEVTS